MEVFVITAVFFGLLFVAFTLCGDKGGKASSLPNSAEIDSHMSATADERPVLRVRFYCHPYWCIEEQRLGFWHTIKRPWTAFDRVDGHDKNHPYLGGKEDCISFAKHLSDPANLARYKKEQSERWEECVKRDAETSRRQQEVINI
jgi:hypothetical protein